MISTFLSSVAANRTFLEIFICIGSGRSLRSFRPLSLSLAKPFQNFTQLKGFFPPLQFRIHPNQFNRPEETGSMFVRNVGTFNRHTAYKRNRWLSSESLTFVIQKFTQSGKISTKSTHKKVFTPVSELWLSLIFMKESHNITCWI